MTSIIAKHNFLTKTYESRTFFCSKKILLPFFDFFPLAKKVSQLIRERNLRFFRIAAVYDNNNLIPPPDYLDWLKNHAKVEGLVFPDPVASDNSQNFYSHAGTLQRDS